MTPIFFYIILFLNGNNINGANIENIFKDLLIYYQKHTEKSKNNIIKIKNSTNNIKLKKICNELLNNWNYKNRIEGGIADSVLLYADDLIEKLEECKNQINEQLSNFIVIEIIVGQAGKVEKIKFIKGSPNECQKITIERAIYSSFWLPAINGNKFIKQKKILSITIDFR